MSQKYIGVKIVEAKPMTRGDYNTYRGWSMPVNENPADEGYLVIYPDGYQSWCPKPQFALANRPTDAMPFGHAIEAMRAGKRVARDGWNGKGIFIELRTPDASSDENRVPYIEINTMGLVSTNEAAPRCVVPWLASQTDMLADDWCVVD